MAKVKSAFGRRLPMFLLASAMALGIFSTAVMPASAATCANWYTYSTGKTYCEDGGCGILWLSDTEYQKTYQKRKCLKGNGDTYYEYKTITNNLGCCD